MIKSTYRSFSNAARLLLVATLAIALTLSSGQVAQAAVARAPVDLGAATHFVILTKTGITNVPTSAITGDLGVSPAAATYITGFSLVADSTNVFSKSSQVSGKIYAANYAVPSPANMTTAISNMQTAYTDAAGRSIPDFTELYAGNLSGKTLVPGLYKWGTGVSITNGVTLAGGPNDVFIFQIAGTLNQAAAKNVTLTGGVQAKNVFWASAGAVTIGTTAHFEGTVLSQTMIAMNTGASMNGRMLAQTAVTLQMNAVTKPAL